MPKSRQDTPDNRKRLVASLRRMPLYCVFCKKRNRLSLWKFVQNTYWYVSPDAQGGGCFIDREAGLCEVICPDCKQSSTLCLTKQFSNVAALIDKYHLPKSKLFNEVGQWVIGNNRVLQMVSEGRIRVPKVE